MREFLARLRDWLRRDRLDAELQEEINFHRAQLERDVGADEARRRLGNVTSAREESRDRWSIPWMEHFFQDVRYALRGLRRSPGFTITVVLTLGLGIGANAAMFGVIDQLMFRPFPYLRDPASVHRVYLQYFQRDQHRTTATFEYTRYLDLKRWSATYDQIAGYSHGTMAIGTGEGAREYRVGRVSASYFDFFDARPALGRFFIASEDTTPRGADVVVLGHAYWINELGGRDVLGETIQIGNITTTIIGVAPEGFVGVSEGEAPAAFIPITTFAHSNTWAANNYFTNYNWGWMSTMIRLKPDLGPEDASRDLSAAHLRSWNAEVEISPGYTPASLARPTALAGPLKNAAGPDAGIESKTLLWVTGVAVIVLLIACANVANLMLARLLRRRRETALRLALGVSRGRLLAQSLTESLLLALIGCAAGVLIAQWGGATLRQLYLKQGVAGDIVTDGRTLAVAIVAALVAGVVTGLLPALLATRLDVAGSLKAGAREGTHQRSRTRVTLLVIQGAMSAILLVGAGLFVRSLGNVRSMRLGFDAEPVLVATRQMRGLELDSAAEVRLGEALLDKARTLPGVTGAASVSSIPFWSTSSTTFTVPGIDSVAKLGRFTYQSAAGDYFETMGTRIVRGRAFTSADRAGAARVVVVSEAMARVLWPGREALGQCIRMGDSDTLPCTTVIGVAEDAVQNSLLDDDRRYRYYLPLEQHQPTSGFAVLIRMRGNPVMDVERVRRELQPVMPSPAYVNVRPLQELIDGQRRSWLVGATMFVAFGMLALLVAAVGLYGVISYGIAQRMHEMGVRIALGAQSGDVVRLVVGQGMRVALAGVVIGLGVALLVAPRVQPLLFEQPARDPVTYAFVGTLLLVVAILAAALPARRATRADPNTALRSD